MRRCSCRMLIVIWLVAVPSGSVQAGTGRDGPTAVPTSSLGKEDTVRSEQAGRLAALGDGLHRQADYPAAEDGYRRAMALFEEVGADGGVAAMLAARGSLAQDRGQYLEALQLYRRSIDFWRKVSDKPSPPLAAAWQNLATLHMDLREFSKAERAFERALDIHIRLDASKQKGVVGLLASLGRARQAQSDIEGAYNCYRRAFEYIAAGGEADPGEVAGLHNHLGSLQVEVGDMARAEQAFRDGLEVLGTPQTHPVQFTNLLVNLGQISAKQGCLEEAVGLLGEAVAVLEKALGADHLYVGRVLVLQAKLFRKLKRKKEAKASQRRGWAILEDHAGESLASGTIHVSDLAPR